MKGLKRIVPALLLVLAVASVAYASEAGGAHGGHGLNWKDFLLRVVNFVIFIGIIYKFAGKKIAELFVGRRKQIETQLADLADRREEAEKKLAEVEKNIANIEQEREAILAEFRAQGESLKASIIEAAKLNAEKITAQVKLTAEQERRAAIQSVRAEVAELVVEAAERLLTEKLSATEHNKLVDDSLKKVVLN
ncbi:F-type H+-transporting ATPase subunit b [Desulfobaculum xiamenense]|uniref:ATP synthase subunit b n=1 Tax=Desulfobaculum xiamenense TaxID=995050 RepID=A0A846QRY5_9BACT|nr:F0F1 ATP synthase subunit B [Desulfobaculum xiamenense]NJB68185.1 F-type H+-transporting ATPase subunit b [Desulfobaculum xiamenense]